MLQVETSPLRARTAAEPAVRRARAKAGIVARDSRIATLIAKIGAACEAPAADQGDMIIAALAGAAADPALLTAEQRAGRADCYARHVLGDDPAGRFTVLAIVWGAAQFSPPHAHHTWCAYAVHRDTLTETEYAFDSVAERANPLRVSQRHAGYACYAPAGLGHIHRLGNAGETPAISIHVYGVGRERIATHVNRLVELA